MLTNLFNRIKDEFAFRRDLAEMEAMDDRQLADIGVTRFELATALRKGRVAAAPAAPAERVGYFRHRAA